MSDAQSESVKAADPLEQWRDLRDGYMGAWAKAMGEAVNSEAYAKSNGVLLETYLTASAPFRDAQKKAMLSALEQLHMPSQADFLSLADRLTNLELLLDDMDAKLDRILQLATSVAAKPTPAPEARSGIKSAPEAKAESKPLFEFAEMKNAAVAGAETKPSFEAKPETKPAPAAKPLFEAKAELKPAIAARAEAATVGKMDTKAAAPRKSVRNAKKGSR